MKTRPRIDFGLGRVAVLCFAFLPACVYGQVTQEGNPVPNVQVSFTSCSQVWMTGTESNGGYAFNPYSTNPNDPTESAQYIPPGNYVIAVAIPPSGLYRGVLEETILYVNQVTVQDWLSVPTCTNGATGNQTPCQRFDAALPDLYNEEQMKNQYSDMVYEMCGAAPAP
jgi:hypothetical protein